MKTLANSLNSNARCPKARRHGNFRSLLLIALVLALPHYGWAATNIVLSTDNLQQKIDAAAPGDVMVIQSGAYSGNISITKPLSFVRSGTNVVQWLGTASINTTGKVTMVQMNFSLAVTVVGGAELLIQDSILNATLNVTGGKVTVKRSNVAGRLDVASGDFIGLRMTNAGGVYAVATVGTGRQFAVTQSSLDFISITGFRSWLAYNTFGRVYHSNCEATLVGNYLSLSYYHAGGGHADFGLIMCVGGTVKAFNNALQFSAYNYAPPNTAPQVHVAGFRLDGGCTGEVYNNTVSGWGLADGQGAMFTYGLRASGALNLKVTGNVFKTFDAWGNGYAIGVGATGSEIANLSYCCLAALGQEGYAVIGSATPFNCITTDPQLDGNLGLLLNSPCINAGPPEPFYKDRDGTRNDMGFTGGPLYQPNGATTSNPLLFFMMPAQRQVWKNSQPTLDVEAAATAGH